MTDPARLETLAAQSRLRRPLSAAREAQPSRLGRGERESATFRIRPTLTMDGRRNPGPVRHVSRFAQQNRRPLRYAHPLQLHYGASSPESWKREFAAAVTCPAQFLFNVFDDVAFDGIPRYSKNAGTPSPNSAHAKYTSPAAVPSIYALMPRREVGTAIQLLLRHKHGLNAHLVEAVQPR